MFAGLSGYGAANGRLNPVIKTRKGERRNNKEMNKKILASIFVIGILALAMGYGTYSYFSRTKTSTGNTFTAGTMDLDFSVTGFALTDIFPCKDLDPVTVFFQNNGSIPGYLYYKVTYTENDKTPNEVDLNADDFAALIYVEKVTYQHYTYWEAVEGGLPAHWGWGSIHNALDAEFLLMDSNGDGNVSLYEMKKVGWQRYCTDVPEGPLPPWDAGRFVITFHMADSLVSRSYPDGKLEFDVEDNWPQADGIDVTWTAVLRSSPLP